jgi:hypothetical protein
MIHIVFQQADVQVLKEAIQLDESLAGEIVEIKDDYAAGPVADMYETEGYQARRGWWKNLLDASPYAADEMMQLVNDRLAVHGLLKKLEAGAEETVWIWVAQNAHDVCGYYWLIAQLKDYYGRIFILFLNNLPFINDKGGIFYPTALHQILPKEFLKAKKLSRLVTKTEFEMDPEEWQKLMQENAFVRTLEGGKKLRSREANFFDMDILKSITHEPQKGSRAMHSILSKMKIKTGDVFLLWRMKALEQSGTLNITGDTTKGWKEFEVLLAQQESTASEGA